MLEGLAMFNSVEWVRRYQRRLGVFTNIIRASCLALCVSAASFAAPVNCNTIATFSGLIGTNGLGSDAGCQIDNLIFSGFSFTANATGPNAAPVTAANIGIQVFANAPVATGFNFIGIPLLAGANSTNDLTLTYNVRTANGQASITSSFLSFTSAANGTGVSTVEETVCLGSLRPCLPPATLISQSVVTNPSIPAIILTNNQTFAPQRVVSVVKDIIVSGGSNGSASISQVTDTFDQTAVPEPSTVLIMSSGLAAAFFVRRRSSSNDDGNGEPPDREKLTLLARKRRQRSALLIGQK
jgi:hypothetical protein